MTKIECAENAILRLKDEGLLQEDFEITSMRISHENDYFVVHGKGSDEYGPVYYRWTETNMLKDGNIVGKKLRCTRYINTGFAPQWNEEKGEIEFTDGIEGHESNGCDIYINDEGKYLTLQEYIGKPTD